MKRRYLPAKRYGVTFLFSFSLLATGMILCAMLAPLPGTTVITLLKLLAGALLAAAFVVLVRFGLISYEYYLVDNRFYVNRMVMKWRRVVCDLDIRLIRMIIPDTAPTVPRTEKPPVLRCHNYTVSLFPEHTVRVYYGTDDAHLHMLLLCYHRDFFNDISSAAEENPLPPA